MKLKKSLAITAATIAASGFLWFLTTANGLKIPVPAYRALRVIDGDTFVTTENQYIRLNSVQAPEKGRCGYEEAKKELEKLVLNKPLYIKVLFHDQFGRQISQVYSIEGNVNEKIVAKGLAIVESGTSTDEVSKANNLAREKKLGIYSEKCTQMENKEQPKCNIKGNDRNGKIYYLPSCGVYHNVSVQLYLGDQWFCTEKEAITSGFRKPQQCP